MYLQRRRKKKGLTKFQKKFRGKRRRVPGSGLDAVFNRQGLNPINPEEGLNLLISNSNDKINFEHKNAINNSENSIISKISNNGIKIAAEHYANLPLE